MNKIITLLIGLFTLANLQAQKFENYAFGPPEKAMPADSLKGLEEAIIKKNYSVHYVQNESGSYQYLFNHQRRWVNSDEAIKSNNRIYVYANERGEYLFQYARGIKPDGTVTNLNKDDIKEGVYENESKYYYYALEGLEKGSVIETATYEKRPAYYYGFYFPIQDDIPMYDIQFEVQGPSHLIFAFNSINGAPEIEEDTLIEDENRWFLNLDHSPEILDQENFYESPVRMAVIFKLDRNTYSGVSDITSYGGVSQNVYKNLKEEPAKSIQKQLAKINKSLALDGKNEEEKVRAIENYVKGNFQIIDANASQLSDWEFMLENKATNEDGCMKLLVHLLDMNDVKSTIVITSDRSKIRFDPKFEAYFYLTDYLLYLPKLDKYIYPGDAYSRLGIVPSDFTNNHGLFIKEVSVGTMTTAVGEIKFIEPLDHRATQDIIDIEVDFSTSLSMPTIHFKKELSGYSALYLQPYYHLLDEEEQKNMKQSLVEMVSESIQAEEVKLSNTDKDDLGLKPFIYEFTTTEHAFTEKAGNDILFKLGETIGPQMEMYQEKERQFDVEAGHNRSYVRTIKFKAPEGYNVKNLDSFNMEYSFGPADAPTMYFSSSWKKEGDTYIIESEEYYTRIITPKEEYEDYRKVINAAADFNKLVVLFEKI